VDLSSGLYGQLFHQSGQRLRNSYKLYGDQGVLKLDNLRAPVYTAEGGSKNKGVIKGVNDVTHRSTRPLSQLAAMSAFAQTAARAHRCRVSALHRLSDGRRILLQRTPNFLRSAQAFVYQGMKTEG
jgi:hypothetical protein